MAHPHPHPHPPQGMPMPMGGGPGGPGPAQIAVNPALQTLLDSIPHTDVPFALQTVPLPTPPNVPPQTGVVVTCPQHKNSACEECGVDFNALNYLHQFLRAAPKEAIPPPPNVQPPPQRAEAIKQLKEQGNTAFKAQQFPQAIQAYSKSADMALSRPPWELAALSRDETAIALCNRSAAFAFVNAWANALADAEAVVTLKRPWTKGHFRKARALVGLERLEDARQALIDGMQYEPNDKVRDVKCRMMWDSSYPVFGAYTPLEGKQHELNNFLKEIDEKLRQAEA
ncbi:translocation protein SEC72 [Kwoniella heveanensis BCC8398]|uniref:Translocation protein SEC72 n=1 Tax=Kwoniella heveanensis BCC8398 TaxID=1296120 RepID=A0A1B9H2T8_9TREE|nr:translocation protein SEC72 [Kwoniella heveanensis BCC8398]